MSRCTIPDGWHSRDSNIGGLSYPAWCGRRSRLLGGGPRALQMVSRRAADVADSSPHARRGVRRDRRSASAKLDHRALFLAFGLLRPRRGRPAVGRGLAAARPRRPDCRTGGSRCGWGRARSRALPAAPIEPDLHRLLPGGFRCFVGTHLGADVVYSFHNNWSRLLAAERWLDFGAAVDDGRRGRPGDGLHLADLAGTRSLTTHGTRRARLRPPSFLAD